MRRRNIPTMTEARLSPKIRRLRGNTLPPMDVPLLLPPRFQGERKLRLRLGLAAELLARLADADRGRAVWVWEEDPATVRFAEPADSYLLGRGSQCHPRLKAPTVSRRHARVTRDDGRWQLEDLGSTHGTIVNRSRVGKTFLYAGDMVELGGVCLVFLGESL